MIRVEAYPHLYRQGGAASRFAYGSIPVSGAAQVRALTGRTPTAAVNDHEHRFARALEYLLRDAGSRAALKQMIESYEGK